MTAQNTLERTVTLLRDPLYVWIDSTVPHMWLPREVCDRFEKAFGLTYDDKTDLYVINETMHKQMLDLDPSVTISLGESSDPTKRVNIVLPYGAFDVQATYPYYKDAVNYFPLRRGDNETQYTLGRTVLQEMYIIADYSRGNFSVHQALFPGTNEKQEIKPIYVPGEEPETQSTSDNSPKKLEGSETNNTSISGGAIGGIVVGSLATVSLIGLLAFFVIRKRQNQYAPGSTKAESELDMNSESGGLGSSYGDDSPPNIFPKYEMPVPNHVEIPGHPPPLYGLTQEKAPHAVELGGETSSVGQMHELEQPVMYELASEGLRMAQITIETSMEGSNSVTRKDS